MPGILEAMHPSPRLIDAQARMIAFWRVRVLWLLRQAMARGGFAMFLFLATMLETRSEDWPQFRGPLGTGVAPDAAIPHEWSEDKNVAWKVAIPGAGWSQPIVVGQTVYVTTAEGYKHLRPKDFNSGVADAYTTSGEKAVAPDTTIAWKVFALDLQRGSILWARTAASGRPKYPIHPSNTYASETPVADRDTVYALFGAAGVVVAFDREGRQLWRRELGVYRQQNNFGTGSSLRLYDKLLYVQYFNEEQSFVVCLHAEDGAEKWRVRYAEGTSQNTPLLWHNGLRTELVVGGLKLLASHDPVTGLGLWRAIGTDMVGIASVSADRERLYFGARSPGKGGPLYALNTGGRGDRSLTNGATSYQGQVWKAPGAAPGMASPLVAGGCIYVANDSFLTCLDALNGKEHYKERLPGLRTVIASPVSVGGQVVILDEAGNAVVLKAGTVFEVLGRSKLEDSFWASPAVSGGSLLFRGVGSLYCIRLTSRS